MAQEEASKIMPKSRIHNALHNKMAKIYGTELKLLKDRIEVLKAEKEVYSCPLLRLRGTGLSSSFHPSVI